MGGATRPAHAEASANNGYVGSQSCNVCHQAEYDSWASSLHANAMRLVSPATMASGRPTQATFGENGSDKIEFTTTKDELFAKVREGSDSPTSYVVLYQLGIGDLEQPLVSTSKGRLQALPVLFDVKQNEWFDIFSGEKREAGDFGHWLGGGMNANARCTSCHSTNYRKHYDDAADTYESSFSEAGVGCESCHGPGAGHVANPAAPYGPFGKSAGIAAHRPKPFAAELPVSDAPTAAAAMLDTCAVCHSLRRDLSEDFRPGDSLLDHFEPELMDSESYWPDGHVRGESYEWGSFVQSRMYQKGVNCLACHDVHSGKLRAKGNDLCLSCHEPKYAETRHTGHETASVGSECIGCHMPEAVFMARDHRRDHSITAPDPLQAKELGIPSACEQCHADRGRERLADDATRIWPSLGTEKFVTRRALTKAFAAARSGDPASGPAIIACIRGTTCETVILRASAARLAAGLPAAIDMTAALRDALKDADPLVRSSAAFALGERNASDAVAQNQLIEAASDKSRAVRSNAAWALRELDPFVLSSAQSVPVNKAFDEWRTVSAVMSDAPETWHSLGLFETARKNDAAAERAYRKAIAMEPRAVPSRQNLAMLLVSEQRIEDAKKELEALVEIDNAFAPAWYALGMIHGEQKNWREAAMALGRCLKADPDYPGALTDLTYAYLEAGVVNLARATLNGALGYPPLHREALAGLVTLALKAGTHEEAVRAAKTLVAEDPSAKADPQVAALAAEPDPPAPSTPNGKEHVTMWNGAEAPSARTE